MKPLDPARILAARSRRGLVALFDLDGTLAPIAPTPEAARIPAAAHRALARLAARKDTLAGVISGRPIEEMCLLLADAGRGLHLVGLHGYESRAPGDRVASRAPGAEKDRAVFLARALAGVFESWEGVRIERKGPIVAVHLRGAAPPVRRAARKEVERILPGGMTILEGRRVLEIRPQNAPTKGDALRRIAARRPGAAVLYVGDDATDEDAFRAVAPDGFSVLVSDRAARAERGGRGRATAARFRLADPRAVARLLARLADAPPAARAR